MLGKKCIQRKGTTLTLKQEMKAFTHYFHKSFWFLYGVSTIYMEDRRQFGLHVPCHVSCSPSNYRLFMARVRFRNNEEKASSSSL